MHGKEKMQEIIIAFVDKFGYFGILLLIAVENIFPPIPSEVILTFGGFLTTYTALSVGGVILFSTLGALVGAIVLYGILLPVYSNREKPYFNPGRNERDGDGTLFSLHNGRFGHLEYGAGRDRKYCGGKLGKSRSDGKYVFRPDAYCSGHCPYKCFVGILS